MHGDRGGSMGGGWFDETGFRFRVVWMICRVNGWSERGGEVCGELRCGQAHGRIMETALKLRILKELSCFAKAKNAYQKIDEIVLHILYFVVRARCEH
jgi:hypothetical protein